MKISLLSRYFDYRNAGIGRVSVELLNGLAKRGHAVIPTCDPSDGIFNYCIHDAIGIIPKIPEADVYHAITAGEMVYLPKEKTITTIMDMIPVVYPNRAGTGASRNVVSLTAVKYMVFAACLLARTAGHITTLSELSKGQITHYLKLPDSRVTVIPPGIRDDLMPSPKRDDVFRIGYLGQLDRRKRVNLLIEAFKATTLDAELVIAGSGIDREKLVALAGDDKRIRFAGFIPDSDIPAFYNSLNFFIFPTWVEGYGLPPVEAMACRTPCVVLDDAVLPDEVRNHCISVPSLAEFFSELPAYYRKYADDTAVGRPGDHARCWLARNYAFAKEHTWERYVSEHEKIYRMVLDNGH